MPANALQDRPDAADFPQSAATRLRDRLIEYIDHDPRFLFPRPGALDENRLQDWIDANRERVADILHELSPELPASSLSGSDLFPVIEPSLRAYVARQMATRWAARQYTDGTQVGPAETTGNGWRFPLTLSGGSREIGQICLDKGGNLLEDKTTSREEFKARLTAGLLNARHAD